MNKDLFIEAVLKANKEILDYLENGLSKEDFEYTNINGFGGDNSLKLDILFENIFIKHLSSFGNIFSEECGFIDNESEFTIVIDPLDGSNNFYSNLPYFGTSVALKKGDDVIAGFVANLPMKTIVYRAFGSEVKYFCLQNMKEKKIFKNDKSKISIFERAYEYPNICKKLNDKNIKFRSLGATALSLANAMDYNFVLFKGEIRDFDVLAGLYICKDLNIYKDDETILIVKNKDNLNFFKEIINDF
ncbi:inositol monophosphatase family protein [Aliarcobacter vitoriensis]|uniref:Inositol phosphatase n=1 Tax=Aliarcobacter vitoriensis TaxID=2011099 RepID=A0A366MUA9_9BACT|nr:inositol monophosphatase family protein [Aliarcobacter vitoriensis]RBQ29841.1 inositol phosphatase [Aliarcobacter vitoriensis]